MAEPIMKTASITTYVGGGGAVFFGLSANDFAAMVGASVAVLGFLVNIWFRWRQDRREALSAKTASECAECPAREV